MDFIILLALSLVGIFAHWYKCFARGQTSGNFKDYMMTHKRHSIASVLTVIGSIAGLYVIGDVLLTKQTLATAFMAGFSVDSAVNKSPEEA